MSMEMPAGFDAWLTTDRAAEEAELDLDEDPQDLCDDGHPDML